MSEDKSKTSVAHKDVATLSDEDKSMIFCMARKLNVVIGLNDREKAWLISHGATFE